MRKVNSMKALIWAEHRKLRRSKIVWIAVFAIVMVAVIVFAQGQDRKSVV